MITIQVTITVTVTVRTISMTTIAVTIDTKTMTIMTAKTVEKLMLTMLLNVCSPALVLTTRMIWVNNVVPRAAVVAARMTQGATAAATLETITMWTAMLLVSRTVNPAGKNVA